jgi:hypothetical protein
MAWAIAQDVRDRWIGPALDVTDAQIDVLIEDAEDTILGEFADIQQRMDDYDDPPTPANPKAIPLARVIKVVSRIVMRHLRNPEGRRSTSTGAGPFNESVTFGGDEPGILGLTDEDRRELSGIRSGQVAFTVNTTPVYE